MVDLPNINTANGALAELLEKKRLVVCVGSGGVGKTTTSAAFAIKAALMGRRSLVVTIDPARRLASSLGLKEIGNEETRIPLETLPGFEGVKGSCHAMMLDTTSAFDELMRTMAKDEASYKRIVNNHIYRIMSDTLAGSHEYVATEKLYDFYSNDKYDLIVLDTPPMKNALDFLEATGRLGRFLDRKVLKWFIEPYQNSQVSGQYNPKSLTGTGKLVFKMLSYIFGENFLYDLYEFFIAFVDMFETIRVRTDEVAKLLRSRDSVFLVITSPHVQVLTEARHFQRELSKRGLPFGGFIVNQVNMYGESAAASGFEGVATEMRSYLNDDVKLSQALEEIRISNIVASKRAQRDKAVIGKLLGHINAEKILRLVPKLEEDIHDIASLQLLNERLFGEVDSLSSRKNKGFEADIGG